MNRTGLKHPRWTIGRIGAIVLLIAAIVLVVGFIGFKIWLKSYLHSDTFRQFVGQQTAAALQVDGAYMPLHWTGWTVYTDGFAGRGRAGTTIQQLRADQIRTEITHRGFLQRIWRAEDIQIQRLRVTLGTVTDQEQGDAQQGDRHALPSNMQPPSADNVPGVIEPVNPSREPHSRWGSDRFEFGHVSLIETELDWNQGSGASGNVSRVRATIASDDDAWLINGTGGKISQAGLPELLINEFRLRYHQNALFITAADFQFDEAGQIKLSGELQLNDRSRLDLAITAQGIPIQRIEPEDWRARLDGKLRGDARMTGSFGAVNDITATGKVALQNGILRALPILDRIATFTQTEQFRQITLQTATANFEWNQGTLTITNLLLESEGLLRVEGGGTIVGKVLDGLFDVGVTATSLRWLPGSQARVFTINRDGYLWTKVRITGLLDRLSEDLSPRLMAAAETEIIEGTKKTIEEGARGVIDLLKPLLP